MSFEQQKPLFDSEKVQDRGSRKRSSFRSIVSYDENARKSRTLSMDPNRAPERNADWKMASTWMIADIVGVGVLGIASGFKQLGWVLGPLMLIIMFPMNVYTAMCLSRVQQLFPQSVTMMDMGYAVSGKKLGLIAGICCYGNNVAVMADFTLACGESLGFTFYNTHWCKPIWALVGLLPLFFMTQLRSLKSITFLCWINMATIIIAVFWALIYIMSQGSDARQGQTYIIPPTLSFTTFFGATTNYVFAYAGHFIYCEMMAEMEHPEDFPKTFYIAGPLQLALYLFSGVVGYYFLGDASTGNVVADALPFSWIIKLPGLCLYFHLMIAYLIKGNITARALHLQIDAENANADNTKAKMQWFGVTVFFLGISYVLANSIPFFEELSGLIGALIDSGACLILPPILFIMAMKKKGLKIAKWEQILCWAIILFGALLTVVGTYQNIVQIIDKFDTIGLPFSCQCDNLWKTCDCSPDHIQMDCPQMQ